VIPVPTAHPGPAGDRAGRRVLVGFAESLAAVEAVWCLIDHGYDVVAFTRAGRRPALRHERRIRLLEVPAPEDDLAATTKAVAQLHMQVAADVVLPLDDAALVVLDELGATGPDGRAVVHAGPTGPLARLAVDKRLQLEAARAAGLSVPYTCSVEPGVAAVPAELPAGEWIVKPTLALAVIGGRLVKGSAISGRGRRLALEALRERGDAVLVQDRVPGVGGGVFGLVGLRVERVPLLGTSSSAPGPRRADGAHGRLARAVHGRASSEPRRPGVVRRAQRTHLGESGAQRTEGSPLRRVGGGRRGRRGVRYTSGPADGGGGGATPGSRDRSSRLRGPGPAPVAPRSPRRTRGATGARRLPDAAARGPRRRDLGPAPHVLQLPPRRGEGSPRRRWSDAHRRALEGRRGVRRIRVAVHVHTSWSFDGTASLGRIAAAFHRRGYDAVLLADHCQSVSPEQWPEYRAACAELSTHRLVLVPGLEYRDADNVVHLPTWGQGLPHLGDEVEVATLLADVSALGGAAILAHPGRRSAYLRFDPAWSSLLAGVEVWNRKYDGWRPSAVGTALARAWRLPGYASLDFHRRRQHFPLSTVLDVDALTEAGIVSAVLARRAEARFARTPVERWQSAAGRGVLAAVDEGRQIAASVLRVAGVV
jgi:hypothetical protein